MQEKYYDLIQKMIVMLGLVYLILFSTDIILPGLVASVFNINILLLAIIVLIGALVANGKKNISIKINNKIKVLLIVFLLVVSIIALYKITVIMILIYLGIILLGLKLLWKNK